MDEQIKIPLEDIAATYTDDEKGERFVFTRNILVKQLAEVSPRINKSFDAVYFEEFKNLSSDLSEVLPLLFVGRKTAYEEKNKLMETCAHLLTNASTTIIAATQTLRCGFRLQSGILLRSVVEMCATVVHLLVKPSILNDFLNDKVKSTKSISIADKQIPLFGKIWGVLSNKQIHINSIHADIYSMDEYRDRKEVPASITIGMLGATTMILSIVVELTFMNEIDKPKFWKMIEVGKYEFIPPSDEKMEWVKKLLAGEGIADS